MTEESKTALAAEKQKYDALEVGRQAALEKNLEFQRDIQSKEKTIEQLSRDLDTEKAAKAAHETAMTEQKQNSATLQGQLETLQDTAKMVARLKEGLEQKFQDKTEKMAVLE